MIRSPDPASYSRRLTCPECGGKLPRNRLGSGSSTTLDLSPGRGASVKLMDTDANQDRYPQPSSQAEGCGFPVMGVVGLLNLSHGGWGGFTAGDWKLHDARAAQRLLCYLEQDDLILANRDFYTYELFMRIQDRRGECLIQLHQAWHRKLDWHRGRKRA